MTCESLSLPGNILLLGRFDYNKSSVCSCGPVCPSLCEGEQRWAVLSLVSVVPFSQVTLPVIFQLMSSGFCAFHECFGQRHFILFFKFTPNTLDFEWNLTIRHSDDFQFLYSHISCKCAFSMCSELAKVLVMVFGGTLVHCSLLWHGSNTCLLTVELATKPQSNWSFSTEDQWRFLHEARINTKCLLVVDSISAVQYWIWNPH